jgi:hypothetical protein
MTIATRLLLPGLGLAAVLPLCAYADDLMPVPASQTAGFRCGGQIIDVGMSLNKVQEYCGPPTENTGDRWIYNRGPDQFTIIIHVQPDNTVGMIEEQPAG